MVWKAGRQALREKNHPIRVLLVYYEPFQSGQTAQVLSLACGLDPGRFQVEVLIPDFLTSTAQKFQQAGVTVTCLPIRKTFWRPKAIAYLFRSVRQHPGSIIHIHSQEAALAARPLAKLAGAKHILYTPQTIDIRRKQYQGIYASLERGLALITERIISVNEADRQRLISWGIPSEKLVTIYNGISLDNCVQAETPSQIRQSLGLAASGPLVMQIGRLTEQKSPLNFIAGAALVIQTHPEVQFILVGDGPLLPAVQERIRALGLKNNIKMAGWQDSAYRLIPAADIITLTSWWEGSPYSLLEGMAWGKPVVATTVNGCPEIVDHQRTGLLVPPGQPDRWAQAVLQLVDNPTLAESFGRAGQQLVEERFSLSQMVLAIENLYEETMGDEL